MSEDEDTAQRLELLRMARELANEEYINKRAEDHNDWLSRLSAARMRGVKLPYPSFVPYPTESDIVTRAITLYNFIKPASPMTTSTSEPNLAPMVKGTSWSAFFKPSSEAVTAPANVDEPTADTTAEVAPVEEPLDAKTEPDAKHSLLRKLLGTALPQSKDKPT